MNYDGTVRRADITFRGKYPEFITIIYKITPNEYLIYVPTVEDFDEIKNDFDHSIRPITCPVTLTQIIPSSFLNVLSNIQDNEIAKNFEGLWLHKVGLLSLLISKFPQIHFQKIEDDNDGSVTIYTAYFKEKIDDTTFTRFLNLRDRRTLTSFLDNLKLPVTFKIIDEKTDIETYTLNMETHHIQSIRKDKSHHFIQRDESIYFDNLDRIFEGNYTKKDLYFIKANDLACYVDYSSFENIDIRNLLFLYKTVYISPPLDKQIKEWLKGIKIYESDFFELIKTGRVKLLLTHGLYRYDIEFINELYNLNPEAIISQKAISTLLQIDIVEMADNYVLNSSDLTSGLKPLCKAASKVLKLDTTYLYRSLAWPIMAKRNSFNSLYRSGYLGSSIFGVNNIIEKEFSSKVNKDLSFDFTVNSPSIQLSSALEATYFPFETREGYSDYVYANIMGGMLNFYKNATKNNLDAFINDRIKFNSGILPINPINVFEVNDYISIKELEEILIDSNRPEKNIKLIEQLASLDEKQREEKISYYNKKVSERMRRNKKKQSVIDLGTNVIEEIADKSYNISLGIPLLILKNLAPSIAKSIPAIKQLHYRLEEIFYSKNEDKANISYLSRINRAARLKRNFN